MNAAARVLPAGASPAPPAPATAPPTPEPAEGLRNGAQAAMRRGDWAAAADAYHALIEALPDDAGLQVQLGHALKESGDLDGAERAYRAFLETAPGDCDIHLQLGHLAKIRRDHHGAILHFDKAKGLLDTANGDPTIAAEIEREIALCLGEITSALHLWPAR